MGDDSLDPNLTLRISGDASGGVAATDQAATGITRVKEATSEAAAIAEIYGVSNATAEKALAILGVTAAEATADMDALDLAMDQAQQGALTATASTKAYTAEMTASAAAALEAAAAEEKLGGMTPVLANALSRLSISEAEVTTTAERMGISLEVAGRAMVQIKQAELAEAVLAARLEMEAMTEATVAEGEAAEVAAAAHELDADALAQRAIMMRRTSDGLVDFAMGGRRAIQGVADIQYVLTKLFPDGAVVLGVIGGIALIGEIWESMSRKMEREHSSATAKIKSNIDEIAKEMESRYLPVLERQLDLQKQIQTLQKNQLSDIAAVSSAKEKSLELDKQIAIEQARQKELVDLGNTSDEGEKNRIRARFKAAESDINGQSGVATATLELQEKQAEIDANKADLAQQQEALNKLRDQIKGIEDQRTQDAQFMAEHGIHADKDGVLIHKKTDSSGKDASTPALADLRTAMQEAIQRFVDVSNLPDFERRNPRAFGDFKKKAEDATNTYEQAEQVQNRNLTTDSDSSVKKLQDRIPELDATVAKTMEAIEKLGPAIENAQKGLESATRADINSEVQSNIDEHDVNAKNPPKYTDTKNVQNALNLAEGDAYSASGLNSGSHLDQISEIKGHIQDAMKAHQDISGFILELMRMMQEFKIGSEKDRDAIRNALTAFKVSSTTNALQ